MFNDSKHLKLVKLNIAQLSASLLPQEIETSLVGVQRGLSACVCERLLALAAILPSQAKLAQNEKCLKTDLTKYQCKSLSKQ